MLLVIFCHFIQTHNIWYHLCMEFFCPAPGIFPTLSTIFHPTLVSKFMGISHFFLVVMMFGFPNRLVVVPLYIIIVFLKYDLSCVTCLLPWKLNCNPLQTLVFLLYTITLTSLSTVCSSPLYYTCWWRICKFPVLSNHWYIDILYIILKSFNICIPEAQQ